MQMEGWVHSRENCGSSWSSCGEVIQNKMTDDSDTSAILTRLSLEATSTRSWQKSTKLKTVCMTSRGNSGVISIIYDVPWSSKRESQFTKSRCTSPKNCRISKVCIPLQTRLFNFAKSSSSSSKKKDQWLTATVILSTTFSGSSTTFTWKYLNLLGTTFTTDVE